MSESKQALGYLLLVFVLGAALGAGGMYWFESGSAALAGEKKGGKAETSTVDWLSEELECTREQRAQLEEILDDTRTRYDAAWLEVEPKFEEARQGGRDRIRAILSDEQKAKFEKLVRRIDEKEKKKKQEQKD